MINKTFFVLSGIVLLVFLGFLFKPSKDAPIKNLPSNGKDIIAFGDSLIKGSGASVDKDFVSLLSKKIGRPIINLGVPGDTTADGIKRVDELDTYDPKVVLLLLGGNDHLRKMPIKDTFRNLSVLIEHIQASGAIVLLLGVRGNLFGDVFKSEFEKLRDTYHTAYVPDVLDGLFGNAKYMEDTIHPNDAGNAIIADRIYPVLLPLIQ